MHDGDAFIHPSASVHDSVQLDAGVKIGPFSVIGEGVSIGKNTRIDANVYIEGNTVIGEGNSFSSYSSIGTAPQDVSYEGEETRLVIGDRNVFREFITINRGSAKDTGITSIEDDNYLMAYSHVGHDCQIGSHTIFTNGATLGGHVTVQDFVYLSALTGIHQFCRIGKFALVGGGSIVTQDILPFCRVAGSRPMRHYGVNAIGLRRSGYARERINRIKDIFKIFFHSDMNTTQAVERIKADCPPDEDREIILDFITASKRGIVKKAGEKWETHEE